MSLVTSCISCVQKQTLHCSGKCLSLTSIIFLYFSEDVTCKGRNDIKRSVLLTVVEQGSTEKKLPLSGQSRT